MALEETHKALRSGLSLLARLREQEAQCKADVIAAQATLEATAAYQALEAARERERQVQHVILTHTRALRDGIKTVFEMTGDKAPLPGVQIKLYKRYVYDHDTTRDWLMFNAPAYLTIDAKRFEKAAETLDGAPVTIENDPRPAIASDLSEYLSE
jgi:hypothetical protein